MVRRLRRFLRAVRSELLRDRLRHAATRVLRAAGPTRVRRAALRSRRNVDPDRRSRRRELTLSDRVQFVAVLDNKERHTMHPAVIDCDVHEDVSGAGCGAAVHVGGVARSSWSSGVSSSPTDHATYGLNPWGYHRRDSIPPGGGVPGSSPEFMAEQLLDPSRHHVCGADRRLDVAVRRVPGESAPRPRDRPRPERLPGRAVAGGGRSVPRVDLRPDQVPEWAAGGALAGR